MSSSRTEIPRFTGRVILPGDAGYESARRVQDETVDRRPALIARCSGPNDVAAALRHAREAGLSVRVRAGGHGPDGRSPTARSSWDLSAMRGVQVDPAARRLRVEGGATWREVDAATAPDGLAVTGARLPSVDAAGFTLGAGSGLLERALGLAGDALVGARVVTAGGRLVRAGGGENPDLLWALPAGDRASGWSWSSSSHSTRSAGRSSPGCWPGPRSGRPRSPARTRR